MNEVCGDNLFVRMIEDPFQIRLRGLLHPPIDLLDGAECEVLVETGSPESDGCMLLTGRALNGKNLFESSCETGLGNHVPGRDAGPQRR